MQMTNNHGEPNIRRLTDYINSKPDPASFATALFTVAALIKPHFSDSADADDDPQTRFR